MIDQQVLNESERLAGYLAANAKYNVVPPPAIENRAEAVRFVREHLTSTQSLGNLRKLSRLYRRPIGWFTGEWEYHPDPDMVRQLNENPRLTEGDHDNAAQFIARNWQEYLGVQTAVTRKELKVFRDDLKNANYMVSRAGWYGVARA